MGMFDGLNNAKASDARFPTLTTGAYEVKVESMKCEPTRKLGNCFFFEFTIVKSSDEAKQQVGQKRKWMQKLSEDTAFPNLKAFLYALHGRDRDNPEDAAAIAAIDKDAEKIMQDACTTQSFKNEVIGVDVVEVQTNPKPGAPNGFPYQRHTWRPAAETPAPAATA